MFEKIKNRLFNVDVLDALKQEAREAMAEQEEGLRLVKINNALDKAYKSDTYTTDTFKAATSFPVIGTAVLLAMTAPFLLPVAAAVALPIAAFTGSAVLLGGIVVRTTSPNFAPNDFKKDVLDALTKEHKNYITHQMHPEGFKEFFVREDKFDVLAASPHLKEVMELSPQLRSSFAAIAERRQPSIRQEIEQEQSESLIAKVRSATKQTMQA